MKKHLFVSLVLLLLPFSLFAVQDKDVETGQFLDTVTIGALDKVMARTSEVTLKIGAPVKVGSLIITALRAWKANIDEQAEAKVFFKITEHKTATYKIYTNKGKAKHKDFPPPTLIFQGWMFASTPSANSLAHPIYDIWVKDVSGNKNNGIFEDSAPLDQETSERIDDLIDQLLETGSDEIIDKEIDIPEISEEENSKEEQEVNIAKADYESDNKTSANVDRELNALLVKDKNMNNPSSHPLNINKTSPAQTSKEGYSVVNHGTRADIELDASFNETSNDP